MSQASAAVASPCTTGSRPAPTPRRFAVVQIGARRHYAIPAILHRAGLLDRFYTDLCAESRWVRALAAAIPARLRPAGLARLLARRVAEVPPERIRSHPWFALRRALGRRPRSPGALYRGYAAANESFGRMVARRGFGEANAVYGFNGAALEVLRWARRHGAYAVLEQTSPPVAREEAILAEERQRWPGWDESLTSPADWKALAEREGEEWQLADRVVCGSQYVLESLQDEAGRSQGHRLVPYGFRAMAWRAAVRPSRVELRALFAGTLCLRKGVQYLAEAARRLRGEGVVIRAVGPSGLGDRALAQLERGMELPGPVPRSTMQAQYDWADVFVLPTLSEGSANVCYEALASGLPVVTTPHAGSVVRDGQEGFLVPIRDAEALADRLARLAADRDLLRAMSANAVRRAQDYTWQRYSQRLLAAIAEEEPRP